MSDYRPDQILGHADEADGIEEYDNKLPAWWLGILYFTIVWGVIYAVDYHLTGDRSQAAEYEAELAAAELKWPPPDPAAIAAAAETPEAAAAGQEIFTTYCVACHGADLSGGIGPSLVDADWIHGDSLEDITRTINDGVPEKGMVSWGPVLGPEKVAQVAAFVRAKAEGS